MNLVLKAIPITEKENLRKLIKEYQKEILKEKPDEYKYLDSYWEKSNRYAYYIIVKEKITGFILINSYSIIQDNARTISELYVKKLYRNKGVGKQAAFKVFDLFPGKWEIKEMKHNKSAHIFWKKIISEYTHKNYKEFISNNDKWRGPIQTFNN